MENSNLTINLISLSKYNLKDIYLHKYFKFVMKEAILTLNHL